MFTSSISKTVLTSVYYAVVDQAVIKKECLLTETAFKSNSDP